MVWNRMQKCAIGGTECNEILSLYLRNTENLSEEKEEGMGEREKREDWEREQTEEKRDKRELS